MKLVAPAKINLSLAILGRRDDGFHQIRTLIVPISLSDTIEMELTDSPGIRFTCDAPDLPTDSTNLVVRAAMLFCERASRSAGISIHLEKRIPHGAGLGGGSSDAATVLLGLNTLLDTGFADAELAGMAAEIGSDVPFFIYRSAAFCEGRGERVHPQVIARRLRLLLLKPPFGVPTPWAYSRWRDSREIAGVPYSPQPAGSLSLFNDLERPVYEKYPFLALLKQWLMGQPECEAALMSGSGSTMFAVLGENADSADLSARATLEFGPTLWQCACESASDLRQVNSGTTPQIRDAPQSASLRALPGFFRVPSDATVKPRRDEAGG